MINASAKSLTLMVLTSTLLTACSHTNPTTTQQPTPTQTIPPTPAPTQATTNSTYSLLEVAAHTTPTDCWLVVHDKVYNVSNFGDNHPGGQAVYQGCGTDATTLFETRPMGSKTPHSDQARSFLPNFYIGDLKP